MVVNWICVYALLASVCMWLRGSGRETTTNTPIKKHGQGRGMCRSFLWDHSQYNEWHAESGEELTELLHMHTQKHTHTHTSEHMHKQTSQQNDWLHTHTCRISRTTQKNPIQLHFFFFLGFNFSLFFYVLIVPFASRDLRNWVVNHQNNKFTSDGDVTTFLYKKDNIFFFKKAGQITMA